jgi:hypothetical protein
MAVPDPSPVNEPEPEEELGSGLLTPSERGPSGRPP